MAKKMTIDEGFEKLSDILGKMDDDNVSLEESFKLYNEGLKLVKDLNGRLDEVQAKLTIVNE